MIHISMCVFFSCAAHEHDSGQLASIFSLVCLLASAPAGLGSWAAPRPYPPAPAAENSPTTTPSPVTTPRERRGARGG